MADFWKGVASTLNLNPAADILSKSILADSESQKAFERWKQQRDYEQKLKSQAELDKINRQTQALAKFQKGGVNENQLQNRYSNEDILNPSKPLYPTSQVEKPVFQPYSTEEMISQGISGGLTPNEIMNKINPKPQDIYDTFIENPHQQLARNKFTGRYETIQDFGNKVNPAYKPSYVERDYGEGKFDSNTGKWKVPIGRYDPKLGEWQKDLRGNPILTSKQYNIKTKNTNGEIVYDKDFQNLVNKDFNNILDSRAKLKYIYDSGQDTGKLDKYGNPLKKITITGTDSQGNPTTQDFTTNDAIDNIQRTARVGINKIYAVSTQRFKNYYDKILKGETKSKRMLDPQKLWNTFQADYINGNLKERDIQSMVNIMRLKYGIADPFSLGVIDNIYSIGQMSKKLKANDNEDLNDE